jgi:hypothetical protein
MGARPHWFYRHAVVTVVATGLLGATIGITYAAASLPDDLAFRASEALVPIGFLALSGGGFLLGTLVGILLVRAGGGSGLECPRCGTRNEVGVAECSACGFSLG